MPFHKNLIVGCAVNYKLTDIEPFLVSWHRNVPGSTLVMLTAAMDRAFYDAAKAYGIEAVDVSDKFDRRFHGQTGRFFLYRDLLSASNRFFVYRDFVTALRNSVFENVFLTDIRDVVFQADPFSISRSAPVWFATEHKKIGDCRYNSAWIRTLYGQEIVDQMSLCDISCSGTTIGSLDGILKYLTLMCGQAEACPKDATIGPNDQAFHNYILWKLKPEFVFFDRDDVIVSTIGQTDRQNIEVSDNKIFVRGTSAPVLHQWDRHSDLESHLRTLYKMSR